MSIVDFLSNATVKACGVEPFGESGNALSTLDWMEQSALGVCISQSWGGYYIMLAFHSLGLAMIVGALMVVDLRILGVARGISVQALPKIVTIGWWGFWINAISGVAVFFSQANQMFFNIAFRWKIVLIVIGVIATVVMSKTVLQPAATRNEGELETISARSQAIFSVLLWLAVIVVGRMIAYLGD